MSVFGSEKIIDNVVDGVGIKGFHVNFDIDDNGNHVYRHDDFVKLLLNALVEFAFGFHDGQETNNTELVTKLVDAAKAIYEIKEFKEIYELYNSGGNLDNIPIADKYLKRGEFGELILHLLLRDFFGTIPLISKIYFKDSFGHTVHGFDCVHIGETDNSLWLGESKLYKDGKSGIDELIVDLDNHLKVDFLRSEFSLISKKLKCEGVEQEKREKRIETLDEKNRLEGILNNVKIPLLCTYTSENLKEYSDKISSVIENEILKLKGHFDSKFNHKLKDKVEIILILFPVRDKNELIISLHQKIFTLRSLNGENG